MLTVTLDLTNSSDYVVAAEEQCGPTNFCSYDKTSTPACKCNNSQKVASQAECDNACNNWAIKDIRCPKYTTPGGKMVDGCYGFSFQLLADFWTQVNTIKPQPPAPVCYAKDSNWDVKFAPADPNPGPGQCQYSPVPGSGQFCSARRAERAKGGG